MRWLVILFILASHLAACEGGLHPMQVTFEQSASEVPAYGYVEINVNVGWPQPRNPFVEAAVTGSFARTDAGQSHAVEGFCDSPDGRIFRVRFAPEEPGEYEYHVEYRQGSYRRVTRGHFRAVDARRRGPIRVDPSHPWHFVWQGTGEHYFFNGTTAYWLFGWRDDSVIDASLERLHRLKVNRVRVTIAGRSGLYYGEPVMAGSKWTLFLTPWPAANAEDVFHPGFDFSRFNTSYWQKIDRAVAFARDRDMVISLVLDMNDGKVHPLAASDDERRFIRYAIARLGAFPNITWDLGDDIDGYRTKKWIERTGAFIAATDPLRHLVTCHPRQGANEYQARTSPWFGFTSFQDWSRSQHSFVLAERAHQRELGRIIPQTNEEYGYEDHYPIWAPPPDGESSDVLRRMAWGIVMAGGYQTTGETARRGTNVWPDAGGGWMNGRGDTTMTMLIGYAHLVDFFTSFPWWIMEPHDELVTPGRFCLAKPGEIYAIYLPKGRSVRVRLGPGRFRARWFDPLTGDWQPVPSFSGPVWESPSTPPATHDWALLIERER